MGMLGFTGVGLVGLGRYSIRLMSCFMDREVFS